MNERFAPELLPHKDVLIRRLLDLLSEQEERTRELDPSDSLRKMIYGLEIERVRYLLTSYMRCRLDKIQSQALYLEQDEAAQTHLSSSEQSFASRYAHMYKDHVRREAWDVDNASTLPESVKDLSKMEMLASPPNLEAYVFCVAMRDCPPLSIDSNGSIQTLEMLRGEVCLLPYVLLRPLLEEGAVLLT